MSYDSSICPHVRHIHTCTRDPLWSLPCHYRPPSVCVCVCVCACHMTHLYVYTCDSFMCTRTHLCVHVRTYMCTRTHLHVYTYSPICVHVLTCMCTHDPLSSLSCEPRVCKQGRVCVCVCVCMRDMCVCVCVCHTTHLKVYTCDTFTCVYVRHIHICIRGPLWFLPCQCCASIACVCV